jgi:uncharacterized membrane protein
MAKTSLNIEENIASMICYIGFWVTGLIFLLLEKENKTVKFHAKQSLFTFLPLQIIGIVLWWIGKPSWTYSGRYWVGDYNPGIPALVWLSYVIWLIMVVLWLIFLIKAYQWEKFKLPIVGDMAEK